MDGARCVDMLIDTGASCCFVRRSVAERMKLQLVPLTERVTVTLADKRTTVATHEVRVASMCVHGSRASCSLLVMDELSNDFIVGLNWQRDAGLAITPGVKHDLLNGRPVHWQAYTNSGQTATPAVVADKDTPERLSAVRLSAVLLHPKAAVAASGGTESLSAASLEVAATDNSQLRQVLQRYQSVFTEALPVKTAQQIAAARQFSIVLVGDDVRPVKQKQRRLSAAEIEAATQWVKDEVAAGRMEPSSSEWAAQLVIVPKRDEEGKVSGWRICGDYRNLNAVTKADAEPLELPQTVFDQLAGMQYFSKLDLLKGFNQIPVAAKSRELMAVSTPLGLYQPTVMPFGVKNAPGSFQREMRRVLQQRLNKGVFVFIDDIIVYSRTEAEHLELIAYVLSQLEKEGYYAHPGKCQFMRSEVSFLGHMVRRDGMSMQQHKVQAVKDWPTLQSVKDVRSFLGLANYYRRFVRGYAQIAQPLTDLTRKEDGKPLPWSWGTTEQKAFDALKRALTSAPVLAHPDPQRQWIVQTDASGVAIGGVLSQKQADGTVRPVAFWSYKLNSAERNYSATVRELMAIVRAAQHWRVYLHGSPHPVLLRSDHKPLIYLNGKAELGMRLTRWMEELCDLTFEIGYVKGKDNAVADALSRRSDHESKQAEAAPSMLKVKLVSAGTLLATRWSATGEWMETPRASLATVQQAAVRPTETQIKVESLLGDVRAAAGKDEKYQLLLKGDDQQDGLQRRDGLVYSRSGAVYVPNDRRLKTRLLELAHDAVGHFGRARTIERLGRHCVWTGMSNEVEDYCRSCAVCAVSKSTNAMPAGKLVPMPIPERVWDSVGVDFTGPLPVTASGNNSIMAIGDRFSKMLKLKACKTTITGIQSGKLLLDEMLSIGRIPTSIVSDRDVRFTGVAWGQLWRGLKTQQKMSTAFHPQTDGQTERANRTLQAVLRSYAESRDDWDEWLPFVAAAYNSTVQESTGRTPFEMNFADARAIDPLQWAIGERRRVSDERGVSVDAERTLAEMKTIWEEVRAKLVLEQAKQKKYADRKRREVTYEVGDSVYLSTRNLSAYGGKLLAKWVGPYLVTKVVKSGVSVRLDLRGQLGRVNPVFHVSQLKPYEVSKLDWPGRQQQHRPAPELVDGQTEWEVEQVTGKEIRMEETKVRRVEEVPVRSSGSRALRQRKPQTREVIVTEEVPVVWYRLKWKGYDEETWQKASDCHCSDLIEAYELLQRQQEDQEAVSAGERTTAVAELGVATVVEWWQDEKHTGGRRGQPVVHCSYACVQPLESGPLGSGAVQSTAVRPYV